MTCTYCDRPVKAKGMCSTHYQRQYRHGGLENRQGQRETEDPALRWLSKILIQPNGCWQWTGGRSKHGYGKIKVNGRTVLAHRFGWFLRYGELKPEEEVDHVCHTLDSSCQGGVECQHRRCVNPDHLEQVSTQENTRRRDERRTSIL